MQEPTLLLADEPTSSLDPKTSVEIMKMFVGLHQQGRTIVMITHDPNVARLAQRRITLRDGAIAGDDLQPNAAEAECSTN